ncbi:MAG: sulfolactaldehyde 3-reductase [Paracoccaceae bacterium]|nr:sulfolactaldehyde 3-reductase [Paracoccaceae bacterium]
MQRGGTKMGNVGFIGLGTMGGPMATNLVRGGHSVKGFDIDSNLIDNFTNQGGKRANNCAETAKDVDFLFTMLPMHDHVNTALFGQDGAIETLKKGATVIDMSTINPIESDKIRELLKKKGIKMIDAPIGRTSKEAKEGKSLLMVGATEENLVLASPLFQILGDTIIDCGGPGTGARMKIINNYMTTILNVLTAEALTFAKSMGIKTEICLSVLNQTPAGKGHLSTTYPVKVLKGDISPAFMIDLALKDLRIGNALSKELNIPLILGNIAQKAYITAQDQGRGKQDWTAIYESLLQQTNVKNLD